MTDQLSREIEGTLNEDLQKLMRSLMPREPRHRYWETPDGRMFLYTTEKFSDGKYGSAVMQPYGPGSRSGKQKVTRWKPTREVHHATRKAAKARAYRLYQQARG